MKRGFTLVELFLAIAIFAIISVAIHSTFSTGLKVWRRAAALNLLERKRLLKIEKAKRELRETFIFKEKEIPFEGASDKVSFPGIIQSEVKKITYQFDQKKKMLLRGETGLREIIDSRFETEKPQPVMADFLEGVKNADFSYFHLDLKSGNYTWKEKWEDKFSFPAAVRLNLTFPGDETFNETVFLPAA